MNTVAIDIRLIGSKRTGDEAVFRNLVRELLRRNDGLRYVLLTDRHGAEREILESVGCDGALPKNAEIRVLPSRNRFTWNLISVPSFLFHERIDVFHTQYILPMAIPRRTRVVVHVHDVSFRAFPKLIGIVDRIFLSIFIPHAMRRADLVVVPSEFTRDEVVAYYGTGTERVLVVPNAVDPGFLADGALSGDGRRVREAYGLPERFVLSVGTMQPRKNIPVLVRAFAALRSRMSDVSLVLVGGRGGRHYDTAIDSAIRDTNLDGAVLFPGYVAQSDMPELYAAAEALIFPSRYEGFGIPLLEAFAAGTPVAASDIPPFHEVGGDAVTYFDPSNVAACAKTLYTLLTDSRLRDRIRRSGRDRLDMFSWPESAAILAGAYRELSGHNQ
ncbi:MAG: glycosyltransferase family 4 protein [Candidatus Moranbacteria bacterium]|nr:glycosyltransferase family 4 protein [Candidatus Moranbacteria bacterium]NTW45537.1 glycosyltransferase family 4 protein [Candidatus Moranbacteria bacterium]